MPAAGVVAVPSPLGRFRSPFLSMTCLVVGAILLTIGLFDPAGFTERADTTLDSEPVREILAGEIVDQITAHGSSRIITVRPLAVFAVSEVVESRPFRAVFRQAVRQARASRQPFDREGDSLSGGRR